jgi:hypothetical protein
VICGWVPRDKVPAFALREPTVKPALAIDSQVRHALLEHLHREEPARTRGKAKPSPSKRERTSDFIDDSLSF